MIPRLVPALLHPALPPQSAHALSSLRLCRGIELPGIGPAAAASRRVVLVVHLLGRLEPVNSSGWSGGHLGPQEPGELPSNGRGDDALGVLAGGQGAKAAPTGAAAPPTPWQQPGVQGPAGGGQARRRPWGGAGRPRPTRASYRRRCA